MCPRGTLGTSQTYLAKETPNTIEESRRARLQCKSGQYRELKREAVRAVRKDKEGRVRWVCETVENQLWSTDYRPAYRGIRTLRSSRPPHRCSTVKAAHGTAMAAESEIRARCAGYFEELHHADHSGSR